MATRNPITIEQPTTDLLGTREPARIAVFLRTKSSLYALTHDQVVRNTCTSLDVPHEKSRLIAIQKWPKLDVLVFDIFYDNYDPNTAHYKVDLPVLLVDYGKASSVARKASHEFSETVNVHVATQHNYHGWNAKPPYFEDQTGHNPPKYENPRDATML
ncbi:hypothetical protein O1611_g297 [Lasiodiplodia mahajangana]|uniref:Uncharacterized protein n=1 Tax=Lasiodiplodia mahajangana TaxID=1108764 RepID=A0ACC2K1B2_9PEZI|nr:hypothetical protein O1611_g297 [Lasiodiplodia mahajangana]